MDIAVSALRLSLNTFYSLISNVIDVRLVVQSRQASAAQFKPLITDPSVFYIRRDRNSSWTKVNIFDSAGNLRYLVERTSIFANTWSLIETSSRRELATIHAGIVDLSFDFHHNKNIQHRALQTSRDLFGRATRKFYLADGAAYEWNRESKYLERVINPGGQDEEVRERIGRARLMRQFRFDWEVLLDTDKIEIELGLATVFLTMVTEWGLGDNTETTGPTNSTDKKQLENTKFHSSEPTFKVRKESATALDTIELPTSASETDDIVNHFFIALENDGKLSTMTELPIITKGPLSPVLITDSKDSLDSSRVSYKSKYSDKTVSFAKPTDIQYSKKYGSADAIEYKNKYNSAASPLLRNLSTSSTPEYKNKYHADDLSAENSKQPSVTVKSPQLSEADTTYARKYRN